MTTTLQDVWVWILAKCDAGEIATYLNIAEETALTLMERARLEYLDGNLETPITTATPTNTRKMR